MDERYKAEADFAQAKYPTAPTAVPARTALLTNKRWRVRQAAAEALEKIKKQ